MHRSGGIGVKDEWRVQDNITYPPKPQLAVLPSVLRLRYPREHGSLRWEKSAKCPTANFLRVQGRG
jgi:hypothetical protein